MFLASLLARRRCCKLLTLLALSSGLSTAIDGVAADISWNGSQNNDWHNANNWVGGVVPGDGDTATLATPVDDTVILTSNVLGIDDLTVQNGIDLFTQGFFLNVDDLGAATTTISGGDASIVVTPRSPFPALLAFATESLAIENGGALSLQGGVAQADIDTQISTAGALNGYGLMQFGNVFTGNTAVLSHSGSMVVGRPLVGAQALTIRALGQGTLDLDGPEFILPNIGEVGLLDVDDAGQLLAGALTLVIDGPLTDPFDGSMLIGRDDTVDFRQPWSFGGGLLDASPRVIQMNGGTGTATLTGATMTVDDAATINVNSGTGVVDAPSIWFDGALNVAAGATAHVQQDITIEGDATIDVDGVLLFDGDSTNVNATLRGGTWTGSGVVDFGGASAFTSNTVVTQATTMNVDVVDLDGGSASTHFLTINSPLTLNVDSIDDGDGNGSPTNRFDDSMVINSFGLLTVNFNDPNDSWVMNGALTLGGVGTVLLAGADVELAGTTSVIGVAQVNARFDLTGVVDVASGDAFRPAGGNGNNPNRILGGTINGPGELVLNANLVGHGTINSDVLVNTGGSALSADDGTLVVNGALTVNGAVGTRDSDGIFHVANPWSTAGGTLLTSGGQVTGATITNDGVTQGFGEIALTGNFFNNGQIAATGGTNTLTFNGTGGIDLDGTTNSGVVNVVNGNLHIQQAIGSVLFAGNLTIGVAREFRIDTGGMINQGTITMNGGTHVASEFDHEGTLNVGSDFSSTIDAVTQFSTGSVTNINVGLGGGLNLAESAVIQPGATFAGSGRLFVNSGTTTTLEHQANVGVEVFSQGRLELGASPGLATVAHYTQSATGELAIELAGTTPGSLYDALVVNGIAALDGDLTVALLNSFVPAPGDMFEIIDVGTTLLGQFSGIGEGELVGNFGGTDLFLTYLGGDGNDVVLFAAAGLPGDFNNDGTVNAADYTVWRDHLGAADESALGGNGDGMNGVDQADYTLWTTNFGATSGSGLRAGASPPLAVPEPGTPWLFALSGALLASRRLRATRAVRFYV